MTTGDHGRRRARPVTAEKPDWGYLPLAGDGLPGKVSAEFFRRLLAGRDFDVESVSSSSNSFTARRK
jgi:hypothetical protein